MPFAPFEGRVAHRLIRPGRYPPSQLLDCASAFQLPRKLFSGVHFQTLWRITVPQPPLIHPGAVFSRVIALAIIGVNLDQRVLCYGRSVFEARSGQMVHPALLPGRRNHRIAALTFPAAGTSYLILRAGARVSSGRCTDLPDVTQPCFSGDDDRPIATQSRVVRQHFDMVASSACHQAALDVSDAGIQFNPAS
jgi:hypothetical protein